MQSTLLILKTIFKKWYTKGFHLQALCITDHAVNQLPFMEKSNRSLDPLNEKEDSINDSKQG